MRSFESKTHSFIVKTWLEETAATGRAKWRIHITHVPDGERQYMESVQEIPAFITSYLEETRTLKVLKRPRLWLNRWWQYFQGKG
jgi:hypothetical protein